MRKLALVLAVLCPVSAAAGAFNPSFQAPGATVGTTAAQALPAGSYVHVQIQNASSSATVACSWGGTPALGAAGSVQLQPGQAANWGPSTGGVPGVALNCVASAAATPLYLEYN